MDNIITITNNKENDIEFDLSVDGVSDTDAVVRFVIETANVNFSFNCTRDGNKWSTTITPLPQFEKTMYPFHIELVVDGYFFKPMTGQVNVVSTTEIYSSEPINKSITPVKKSEVKGKPSGAKNKSPVKENNIVIADNKNIEDGIEAKVKSILASEAGKIDSNKPKSLFAMGVLAKR